MLERTSRFVLEVMPYLLAGLIAVLLVPSFLFSQAQGAKAVAVPYVQQFAVDHTAPGRLADTRHGTRYR